jgi:hypothetical protein
MSVDTKKLIEDAPDKCPITGMYKCVSYTIGGNVVYLPKPAYDAYTYPIYSEEDKAFYHTKYDMDNDCMEENLHLCDLQDIETHSNIAEIKRIFNIK